MRPFFVTVICTHPNPKLKLIKKLRILPRVWKKKAFKSTVLQLGSRNELPVAKCWDSDSDFKSNPDF